MICETCHTKFNKCSYCSLRKECLDKAEAACHLTAPHFSCPVCEPILPKPLPEVHKEELPKAEVISERTLAP